jgi:hypothetical protein
MLSYCQLAHVCGDLTNVQEAKLQEAFGEEKAAWQIAPRTLPPPTGGSDEIRKSQSPASTRAQPQRRADN